MDFTYFIAFAIAFLVGVISQIVRLALRAHWTRPSGALATGCALIANGLLLLNWSHLLDWGVGFAVLDLGIIAAMSLIGLGASAPGAIGALFRK